MTLLARSVTFALVMVAAALTPVSAQPQLGHTAPPFRLRTLDGRVVNNASFAGRVLVINVWGSWCPPCRIETPDLAAQARSDTGRVAFLGVDTTETVPVVRAFAAAKGVPYLQAVVAGNSAFAAAYDIRNYPTTFVIDAHGVLRARHADNVLPRVQLRAYIAAAQRGASAPLVSAEQAKLDAMLAPKRYPFDGGAAAVRAHVRAAADAIAGVESEMDDAMTDPARDHDLVATQAREQTLRDAAIGALTPIAVARPDRALLARLRADAAAARGNWPAAQAAYAAALALDPNDRGALAGAAYAAAERGDLAGVARLDRRLALAAPSYSSEMGVARSQAKLGHRAPALAALARAIALARASGKPTQLAWTHLYGGRTAVDIGDSARARAEFAAAARAAAAIPHTNPRYEMYLEQAQEGSVALSLGTAARAGVSLVPWTGPELPGSIASTFKYRLAVTAKPDQTLDLHALGLPKGWIASFCSDRVCAPFSTSIVVPAAGVKIVEFQVIPNDTRSARGSVIVEAARQGHVLAQASATVNQ